MEEIFREAKEEIEWESQGDQDSGKGTCDCPCKSGQDGRQHALPQAEEVVAQVVDSEVTGCAAREKTIAE